MATCGKCKRPLTDPRSVKRGYGPDCWRKVKEATAREEKEALEEEGKE